MPATELPTPSPLPEISEEAGKVLFALFTGGKWGIINGLGEIIVEPIYSFSAVLVNGLYFVSSDPIRLTTGKIYRIDGTRFFPELGELTIFGGGPDCNTAHVVTDVFLYGENGLKGLLRYDGTKLTEAKYEEVRSDYSGKFFRTLRNGKFGTATVNGELTPPVFDDWVGMGILGNNDIGADIIFSYGRVNGEWAIYKGDKLVPHPNGRVYQIQDAILIQDDFLLTMVDESFNPIFSFPDGVSFAGYSDRLNSTGGLIRVRKDGMNGVADNRGNMVIPFGYYWIEFDQQTGKIRTRGFDTLEGGIELDITFTVPERTRLHNSHRGLPETVFSLGISPYRMQLGGWVNCVTDSTDLVRVNGLHALLSSSFSEFY